MGRQGTDMNVTRGRRGGVGQSLDRWTGGAHNLGSYAQPGARRSPSAASLGRRPRPPARAACLSARHWPIPPSIHAVQLIIGRNAAGAACFARLAEPAFAQPGPTDSQWRRREDTLWTCCCRSCSDSYPSSGWSWPWSASRCRRRSPPRVRSWSPPCWRSPTGTCLPSTWPPPRWRASSWRSGLSSSSSSRPSSPTTSRCTPARSRSSR